jgi:hypothetical protein
VQAAEEFVRRGDRTRMLRVMQSSDPEVAIVPALALAEEEAHTEAVVATVLRIFPGLKDARGHHVLHRMGARLQPYVSRILERHESDPTDRWFGLLEAVDLTRPHLVERTWLAFEKKPDVEAAKRVARLGEYLLPRVLAALGSSNEGLRTGAAWVLVHARERLLVEHHDRIRAVLEALDAEDLIRRMVESTLRERDCDRGEGPYDPWTDLR